MTVMDRLNASLEKWLPEQRLFLRSDDTTRFVRLRPVTQMVGISGITLVFGWTLVASSFLVIDAVSSGNTREQIQRSQAAFEERLAELQAERDARAAEALAAQSRFAVALDQVSQMQSQLLSSEESRREMETGLAAVQSTLRDTLADRDTAVAAADAGTTPAPDRTEEFSVALDILSGELRSSADQRSEAVEEAEAAKLTAQELTVERDQILARNDEILTQLEDAVTVSVAPWTRSSAMSA